jgi:hypothetical protein
MYQRHDDFFYPIPHSFPSLSRAYNAATGPSFYNGREAVRRMLVKRLFTVHIDIPHFTPVSHFLLLALMPFYSMIVLVPLWLLSDLSQDQVAVG